MTVGERIKRIRQEKGMTQKELGDKCGLADSAIRRYELGGANPKIETIQKIADALEVDISAISGFLEYKQSIISNNPALSAVKRLGIENEEFGKELIKQHMISRLDITEDKEELLYNYNKLNGIGKEEARKRVAELTEISRYIESDDVHSPILNAAHRRTDIEVTEEDEQ